ncbi:hypothetical protein [Burkholderia cepacia]|uniref:hypothetical protein n=1 Tax=Burkholderia cepacia TaxID=292 RepID=UPI0035D9E969
MDSTETRIGNVRATCIVGNEIAVCIETGERAARVIREPLALGQRTRDQPFVRSIGQHGGAPIDGLAHFVDGQRTAFVIGVETVVACVDPAARRWPRTSMSRIVVSGAAFSAPEYAEFMRASAARSTELAQMRFSIGCTAFAQSIAKAGSAMPAPIMNIEARPASRPADAIRIPRMLSLSRFFLGRTASVGHRPSQPVMRARRYRMSPKAASTLHLAAPLMVRAPARTHTVRRGAPRCSFTGDWISIDWTTVMHARTRRAFGTDGHERPSAK